MAWIISIRCPGYETGKLDDDINGAWPKTWLVGKPAICPGIGAGNGGNAAWEEKPGVPKPDPVAGNVWDPKALDGLANDGYWPGVVEKPGWFWNPCCIVLSTFDLLKPILILYFKY